MTAEMRDAMGSAAVEAARAVGYVGAGTVEFIADGREGLRPDRFYFMEMNTRLQVEHPVTEAITGLDLVELQFRVAAGERLPFAQDDLAIDGHAVEARLYAEDPEKEFLPSTGKLWALDFPDGEGIRVDTGVEAGDEVTPYYDPMIAKVIAHGATREEALDRLAGGARRDRGRRAEDERRLPQALCEAPEFRAGAFDTGFIDRNLEALGAVPSPGRGGGRGGRAHLVEGEASAARRTASRSGDVAGPWERDDGFQLSAARRTSARARRRRRRSASTPVDRRRRGTPDGRRRIGRGASGDDFTVRRSFDADGRRVIVLRDGRQTRVALHDPFAVDLEHMDEGGSVKAPMHGKLIAVFVQPGDRVEKGQRLAIVEAMKMEHALVAPADGEVAEVAAEPGPAGAQVAEGARLIVLKTESGRIQRVCGASPGFARRHAPWLKSRMALHLIKLCVGCDSITDLEEWIEENRAHHRRLGRDYEQTHTTRMVPKRMDELVDGGSLFWVIKGQVACRQTLLAVGRSRTGWDRALPPRAGADGDPGRAAALSAVPGLALPRRQGCPPRPRCEGGRSRPHAGGHARSWPNSAFFNMCCGDMCRMTLLFIAALVLLTPSRRGRGREGVPHAADARRRCARAVAARMRRACEAAARRGVRSRGARGERRFHRSRQWNEGRGSAAGSGQKWASAAADFFAWRPPLGTAQAAIRIGSAVQLSGGCDAPGVHPKAGTGVTRSASIRTAISSKCAISTTGDLDEEFSTIFRTPARRLRLCRDVRGLSSAMRPARLEQRRGRADRDRPGGHRAHFIDLSDRLADGGINGVAVREREAARAAPSVASALNLIEQRLRLKIQHPQYVDDGLSADLRLPDHHNALGPLQHPDRNQKPRRTQCR